MASKSGTIPTAEGVLFFKYTTPSSGATKVPLVFSHAGVANHTMWDSQVAFFSARGHPCLVYDRFGYGGSEADSKWLSSSPRSPVDHDAHLLQLVEHVLPAGAKVVVVGCSMGGGQALQFAVSHPERVAGVASLAGGVPGFDHPNKPAEDALFEQIDAALDGGNAEQAARLQVRVWGDGPLQQPGRMNPELAALMLGWNVDISRRECDKTGGEALDGKPGVPKVLHSFDAIRVPTAIGWGTFDETNTSEAMKLVASKVQGAIVREFPTAHIINLEMPDEVNAWLEQWLETVNS